MFIWANKWRVLFLLCCLLLLCDGWPTRRRKPLRRFSQRFRRKGRAPESSRNVSGTALGRSLGMPTEDHVAQDAAPELNIVLYTDEGERLYEGDMVLDQEQIEGAFSKQQRRKASGDLRHLWPDAHVPFVIGPASEPDREVILQAIDHWQTHSCVTFEEKPLDEPNKFAHLIFRKLTGCHSNVGRKVLNTEDGQTVSLGVGCNRMGIAAHEIGHALGFFHEQSRPDRDEYLKVFEENVKEEMLTNFNLMPNVKYFGVPYDYDSVMHYTLDAFTKNKKNTMVAKDLSKTFRVGQRLGLSFYDLKLANTMYNCSDGCTNEIACKNDGFVDKSCECICPPGFEGSFCQFKSRTIDDVKCGGFIEKETTISSPNFPNNYPKGLTCIWEIESPPGQQVHVTFNRFSLDFADLPTRRCFFDVVEVRPGPDLLDGEKFCGDELNGQEKVSVDNKMNILFHTKRDENIGFQATIKFD